MTPDPALSRPLDPESVHADGATRQIVADAGERAELTSRLGLLELQSLSADLTLTHWRKDGLAVKGRLRAMLSQECVVTLEPVHQTIDEEFEVRFVPAGSSTAGPRLKEVAVDPDAEDPPDVYEGAIIDLGAVVEEQLALAIDPYPRAPDATLAEELPASQDEDETESPFAVLAKLKAQGKTEK